MGSLCPCVWNTKNCEDNLDDTYSSSGEAKKNSKSVESSVGTVPKLEFNDTNLRPSTKTFFHDEKYNDAIPSLATFHSLRESYRKKSQIYASSLAQTIKFCIGNEVLCMTWNLHHTPEGTPYDFYCDFRTFGLTEHDTVMIEIIWDVARVVLYTDLPTKLCKETLLSSCVPSLLLSPETCSKFCSAAGISDEEAALVMAYHSTTLNDFLLAHSYKNDGNALRKRLNFINLHKKSVSRATAPLLLNYNADGYEPLLKKDPTLLPLLILDSLHVLVIRLSIFLIENQLQMAFSEYKPDVQIERLTAFFKEKDINDLSLPKHFDGVQKRLYKKWRLAFQDANKIKQLMIKATSTKADIILLQQLTASAFDVLTSKLGEVWVIFPKQFPPDEEDTTAICVRRKTVTVQQEPKIRRIDAKNFAILCKSSGILFYVGVVHLPEGGDNSQLRRTQALKFQKLLGKSTPVILGGEFNEDLTAYDNTVAEIMHRYYNGIDHTQEQPLEFCINRTRTNLQCDVLKADKLEKGVDDGIFSSFPLVGEAFTDFLHSGLVNPSDHGPIFQRVSIGLL